MTADEMKSPLREMVTAAQAGDAAAALAAAKRGYGAFLRGELSLDDPVVDPDLEWVPLRHGPTAGIWRGATGAAEEVETWSEPFDDFRWEPKEVVLGEDRFVIVGDMSGRGRTSGIETRAAEYHVWSLRRGRIVRMEMFPDRPEALAAAGVTATG